MFTSQAEKTVPTCSLCGRKLGVGFYYTCHICGRSYCYAHIPVKCNHNPTQFAGEGLPAKVRR